jgi:transcriptional regulator with XRE-family HTH domain
MVAQLGEKIRQLRKQNKLTLKEIAAKTGVSISFLSQLEHGKTSATLESLRKISDVLGVNPSYFFPQEMDGKAQTTIQRGADNTNLEETSFIYKNLIGNINDPLFTPLFIVLQPGDNRGNLFSHQGQEFLFVLEGTLTVLIQEETYELQVHDSIFIDASKPHYWRNDTTETIKFLCINATP